MDEVEKLKKRLREKTVECNQLRKQVASAVAAGMGLVSEVSSLSGGVVSPDVKWEEVEQYVMDMGLDPNKVLEDAARELEKAEADSLRRSMGRDHAAMNAVRHALSEGWESVAFEKMADGKLEVRLDYKHFITEHRDPTEAALSVLEMP